MKKIKFNSHGYDAPAYGCSEPGDNSGEYLKVEDVGGLKIDLHSKIMNIQVDDDRIEDCIQAISAVPKGIYQAIEFAYKLGHRDARHDAAELVTKEIYAE